MAERQVKGFHEEAHFRAWTGEAINDEPKHRTRRAKVSDDTDEDNGNS